AMVRYTTALQICEEHGYLLGAIRTLNDLGAAARDQGKHAESLASFQKSLSLMGRRGDLRVVIDALEGAAQAAVAWDRAPLAARLLGAAAALGDVFGVSTRVATTEVSHTRVVRAVHEKLDDRAFDDAYAHGRQLTLEDAIAEMQAMSPPTAVPATHVPSGVMLSVREEEVLRLIAAGYSDREISAELYLSVRTIEAHGARIRTKLGVRTRAAAVAAAVAAGIVVPSSSSH
ncbi:MAG TPA: helix-turn-helix transcriptional regulator, partial [Chloroflexota bacterium]|nr:helix-turn-helix transcriptional regulator [Chloroflexota bacterium]